MLEKEKKIIEVFALLIPKLSENDKSYLLGLGEGMAIKERQRMDREKEGQGGMVQNAHYMVMGVDRN